MPATIPDQFRATGAPVERRDLASSEIMRKSDAHIPKDKPP